ncbi:MAG: DUF3096 domain-containing protein [Nanoarchaeota archaeon]|nr:DUF3096 domain-containing protein [Nanoarchaeota archaeon]
MADIILLTSAILAIVVGIVILVWPKILNLAVALYFLIIGALKLIAALGIVSISIPSLLLLSLL